MNIYIHVEVSLRELDSKLLLGVLAASKGNQVLISDLDELVGAINNGILPPGIFHTKSLTPSKAKLLRHKTLIEKGCLITSIDEEAGLDLSEYEEFANTRYSKKTIEQASLVFTWGTDDTVTLKKKYPESSYKIYKTGSPRVDQWRSIFSDYWSISQFKKKPFLLVSSNFGLANNNLPFYELYRQKRDMGYYERYQDLLAQDFGQNSEQYITVLEFMKAIKYLSVKNNDYDIIVRPHPTENIQAWRTFLEGLPNVHVIRKNSISEWVQNAFAVMHNGCTTAFETVISKKPLLTYIPYKQNWGNEIPNQLGFKIRTENELSFKIDQILKNKLDLNNQTNQNFNVISNKIFIDENELAAEKIVNLWNKISNKNSSKNINIYLYKFFLTFLKIKKLVIKLLKTLFPSKFGKFQKDLKFEPLNKNDISKKINLLIKILKLDREDIKFEIISDKVILIKKNKY
tara:strand:- start:19738 stop:21111 length:1374 start_codon:yes stop_codon:yes gene_type:complete